MLACVLGSDEWGDRRRDRSTRDSGRCVNESGKRACREIFEPGLSADIKPVEDREQRPSWDRKPWWLVLDWLQL